jgi:hypothetical protein
MERFKHETREELEAIAATEVLLVEAFDDFQLTIQEH